MTATADTAAEIDRDIDNAIQELYARSSAAKELSTIAKAILVFPKVVKGGLIVGSQYGGTRHTGFQDLQDHSGQMDRFAAGPLA
ncbi:MAG: hypothetical protein WBM97_05805 [Sedimenticolaceae bacterium]